MKSVFLITSITWTVVSSLSADVIIELFNENGPVDGVLINGIVGAGQSTTTPCDQIEPLYANSTDDPGGAQLWRDSSVGSFGGELSGGNSSDPVLFVESVGRGTFTVLDKEALGENVTVLGGSSVFLHWDGNDSNNTEASRCLTPVDLTEGGTNTRFRIVVSEYKGLVTGTLRVRGPNGSAEMAPPFIPVNDRNFITISDTLTEDTGGVIEVPITDFTKTTPGSTLVDVFREVQAIELILFLGFPTSPDQITDSVTIDEITVVSDIPTPPPPATITSLSIPASMDAFEFAFSSPFAVGELIIESSNNLIDFDERQDTEISETSEGQYLATVPIPTFDDRFFIRLRRPDAVEENQ